MRNKRVLRMTRFDNERCSDRLLARVLLQDMRLNPFHQLHAKEPCNRKINTAIHQPKRIRRTDHTVKLRQRLESAADHRYPGTFLECYFPLAAERFIRV